jgi:acyl-coenzyme A thioesterase PaaI-like protein
VVVALSMEVGFRFPPPAEGWSTVGLLAVVDTALRGAAGVEATVAHLNVTRLREAQAVDVIALSRVLRRERDTVHAECWLFSHAVVEAMLHATATLRTSVVSHALPDRERPARS